MKKKSDEKPIINKPKVTLLYFAPNLKSINTTGGHVAVSIQLLDKQGNYNGLYELLFDFPNKASNIAELEMIYGKAAEYRLPPPGKILDFLKLSEACQDEKRYNLLKYNCSDAAANFLYENLGYIQIMSGEPITTPMNLKERIESVYSLQTKLDKILEFKAHTSMGKKNWDSIKDVVKKSFKLDSNNQLPHNFQSKLDWLKIRNNFEKFSEKHMKPSLTIWRTQSTRYLLLSEILAVVNLYCSPEKEPDVPEAITNLNQTINSTFLF